MTAQKAYEIIKNEHPRIAVVECLDFADFYAFGLVESGKENEPFGGGYFTVNKISGEIGGFSPPQDFEAFFAAKPIDTSTII